MHKAGLSASGADSGSAYDHSVGGIDASGEEGQGRRLQRYTNFRLAISTPRSPGWNGPD